MFGGWQYARERTSDFDPFGTHSQFRHSLCSHLWDLGGRRRRGDDEADLSRGAEVEESPEATENELDDGTNEGAKEAMETQHHSV